jgi:predicted transcriptional regulator
MVSKKIDYKKVDKLKADDYTTAQIAKKLNVSYSAIYNYFQNKKDVKKEGTIYNCCDDEKEVEIEEISPKSKKSKVEPRPVDACEGRNPDGTFIPGVNYNGSVRNNLKKIFLHWAEKKDELDVEEDDTNMVKFVKRVWRSAIDGEDKACEIIARYLMSTPRPATFINEFPIQLKTKTPKELKESMEIVLDYVTQGDLDIDSGEKLMNALEMHRAFIAAVDFQENLKETQRQFMEAQEKRKIEDRERLSQLQQLQELTRSQNVKQTLAGKK